MAIVVTDQGHTNSSAGATMVLTVAANAAAGDVVVVVVQEKTATGGGTLTDSAGNTYSSPLSALTGGTGNQTYIFYSFITAPLSAGVSTLTYTKAVSGVQAAISALSASGCSSLDTVVNASATGTSTTPSVTSGTPAVSGELFVAALGEAATRTITQDTTHSWAAPFTADVVTVGIGGGSQVNAGVSTIIYSPTLSASTSWAVLVVAFKPATASTARGFNMPMLGM